MLTYFLELPFNFRENYWKILIRYAHVIIGVCVGVLTSSIQKIRSDRIPFCVIIDWH